MFSVPLQALRSWKSAKGIAVFAAVALTVGIGSATAIFTIVNGALLTPLPYASGERFVALFGGTRTNPEGRASSSLADLTEYERRASSFDVFGWFRLASFNLTSPGQPQHITGAAVTPALARNLGVEPLIGAWFADDTGAALSHTLWRRLGGSPALVGQGITLNGRLLTITGVMPPAFQLPVAAAGTEGFTSEVWVSLDPGGRGEDERQSAYFAYARRKPGVSLAQAVQDVERVSAEIVRLRPASHSAYVGRLEDLHTASIRQVRPTLLLLFAAAGLLLLIACANVATLLVARSVSRARETAIHIALGAPQQRLALFYFAEALVVALAGAVGGMLLSVALVRGAAAIGPEYMPAASALRIDLRILLFSIFAALVATTLSSLAPLWQTLRTSPRDVLGDGVRTSAGVRARRLSQSLVVAEIALAFGLLGVCAVMVGHLRELSGVPAGFDASDLLVFELTVPDDATRAAQRHSYQRVLAEAIQGIPGVTSAALASGIPLDGCCFGGAVYPEDSAAAARDAQRNSFVFAGPEYLRTLRIPLRGGRFLERSDEDAEALVNVVVNEAAAATYWPGRNPVGAFGRFGAVDGTRFQVVGVAGSVRNDGLGKTAVPEFYLPATLLPFNPIMVAVRSPLPAATVIAEVRRALQQVDSTVPMHHPRTMLEVVRHSLALERASSMVMAFFAAAALLMATLGTYGVISYTVRQRTVEIGTRMALGAMASDVLALVLGNGMRMAVYGVAAGSAIVAGSTWLLVRFFDVRSIGPLPFLVSTAVVLAVAMMASLFPAWRAAMLSPLVALRRS